MAEPEGVISRAQFLTLAAGSLLLGGCAKFPPAGTAGNFTRLSFRYTVAGAVNPNYIYVVAIRVLDPPVGTYSTLLSDPSQGPSPVVDVGSKNGVVGGLPTHYVVYVPNTSDIYRVYRFPLSTEQPDPSDPAPINLNFPGIFVGDVLPGSAVNPQQTDGTFGNQLGFDIDTSYLAQHATSPQVINVIQFNILTMNVAALSSSAVNGRVMDAIGNQSDRSGFTFSNPIRINIKTGGTYTDQTSSVPEQAGDTFPAGPTLPPVDLTSWSVAVTMP